MAANLLGWISLLMLAPSMTLTTEDKPAFTASRPRRRQTIMTLGEVGERIKNGTVWLFGPEREPWGRLIIPLSDV